MVSVRSDSYAVPPHSGSATNEGICHGSLHFGHGIVCRAIDLRCADHHVDAVSQSRWSTPIRLTLRSDFCDDLDGAWWPRTASVARELAELIEALQDRLGQVVDIALNWSSIDGLPDLDSLTRRGVTAIPGWNQRKQRVMTVTGDRARVNLLVVPSRTTAPLAMMVLRHAAALPIRASHYDTAIFRAADDIVRAARAECGQPAAEPVSIATNAETEATAVTAPIQRP